jgi:hypothetical protein
MREIKIEGEVQRRARRGSRFTGSRRRPLSAVAARRVSGLIAWGRVSLGFGEGKCAGWRGFK